MNTTPTTKAKPTAGPWYVDTDQNNIARIVKGHPNKTIAISYDFRGAWEANANLIAEAGTVYHETGLTPRELVERIKQMKEAFALLGEKLVNMPETLEKQDCYSIINKATE